MSPPAPSPQTAPPGSGQGVPAARGAPEPGLLLPRALHALLHRAQPRRARLRRPRGGAAALATAAAAAGRGLRRRLLAALGAALRGPGRRGLRRRRTPLPAVLGRRRRRRCLVARVLLQGAGAGRRRRLGAAGPEPLPGRRGARALPGTAGRRAALPGTAGAAAAGRARHGPRDGLQAERGRGPRLHPLQAAPLRLRGLRRGRRRRGRARGRRCLAAAAARCRLLPGPGAAPAAALPRARLSRLRVCPHRGRRRGHSPSRGHRPLVCPAAARERRRGLSGAPRKPLRLSQGAAPRDPRHQPTAAVHPA